ncbi:MAG: ribonuclease III [Patescibacteria group bacterium]
MNLDKVQQDIRYNFRNVALLKQALVHRSYLNEKDKDVTINEHNERLEFLGDAVLELVVTEHLYVNYSQSEGLMTAVRAALVNYKLIGEVGNSLGLDQEILLSKGEKEELGKARLTIVADGVEAVIGAIYLDGGMEPSVAFVNTHILSRLEDILTTQSYKDHKTLLQEFSQKHTHYTPQYRVISSQGRDHEKVFTVGVWIGGELLGQASGRSKQDAETASAGIALKILQGRFAVVKF